MAALAMLAYVAVAIVVAVVATAVVSDDLGRHEWDSWVMGALAGIIAGFLWPVTVLGAVIVFMARRVLTVLDDVEEQRTRERL